MLMFHMQLEDVVLNGEYREEKVFPDGKISPAGWYITILDLVTAKQVTKRISSIELGAILALAHGLGEDLDTNQKYNDITVKTLYAIAEGVIEDLPNELRPIP